VLSAIQGQREPGAGDRPSARTDWRSRRRPSRIRLAVTHELGLSCEQASRDQSRQQGYRRPGSQAMVSCPSWRTGPPAACCPKTERVCPPSSRHASTSRSWGDQLAHAGGNALEEPARVELVPHRAGESRDGAMQRGQVDVDRSHAWSHAADGAPPSLVPLLSV